MEEKDKLPRREAIEKEFFRSLKHLADLYQFELPDVAASPYPYNIYLAFAFAKARLKETAKDLKLAIINDHKHHACLATLTVYNTGRSLYYVPLDLLHLLRGKMGRKASAELLSSVYAYFMQALGLPSYTKGDYLGMVYTMLEEWTEETGPSEWGEQEYYERISEFRAAQYWGGKIHKQISHPYTLQQFGERIKNIVPLDGGERALLAYSKKLWKFYRKHPNLELADIMLSSLEPEEEEMVITTDQYISFVWSTDNSSYEEVEDFVSNEFQEMDSTEEPLSIQLFDCPQMTVTHNFDVEKKLFRLLSELFDVINGLKKSISNEELSQRI